MAREVYKIKAIHGRVSFDMKAVKQIIKHKPVFESSGELHYSIAENKYLMVINYGVIVFFNFDNKQSDSFLIPIRKTFSIVKNDELSDEFEVVVDPEQSFQIEFNRLTLQQIDINAIKIILLNLAQSLALTHYDHVSQDLLSEIRSFTSEMEHYGKLKISHKDILKFIGKGLNTQNRIVENLYILDSPAITWENEYYNQINGTLRAHFELNSRYRSIENTMKIIEANLQAFLEVNNHRESSKLEWIIIVLILVEVIDTFVSKLF